MMVGYVKNPYSFTKLAAVLDDYKKAVFWIQLTIVLLMNILSTAQTIKEYLSGRTTMVKLVR